MRRFWNRLFPVVETPLGFVRQGDIDRRKDAPIRRLLELAQEIADNGSTCVSITIAPLAITKGRVPQSALDAIFSELTTDLAVLVPNWKKVYLCDIPIHAVLLPELLAWMSYKYGQASLDWFPAENIVVAVKR